MQWISVKSQLPEVPESAFCVPVLVADFNNGDEYAVYEASYGYLTEFKESKHFITQYHVADNAYIDITVDTVTHWMYLPEPPEVPEAKVKYVAKEKAHTWIVVDDKGDCVATFCSKSGADKLVRVLGDR
jgi:hypothetical protein